MHRGVDGLELGVLWLGLSGGSHATSLKVFEDSFHKARGEGCIRMADNHWRRGSPPPPWTRIS